MRYERVTRVTHTSLDTLVYGTNFGTVDSLFDVPHFFGISSIPSTLHSDVLL